MDSQAMARQVERTLRRYELGLIPIQQARQELSLLQAALKARVQYTNMTPAEYLGPDGLLLLLPFAVPPFLAGALAGLLLRPGRTRGPGRGLALALVLVLWVLSFGSCCWTMIWAGGS